MTIPRPTLGKRRQRRGSVAAPSLSPHEALAVRADASLASELSTLTAKHHASECDTCHPPVKRQKRGTPRRCNPCTLRNLRNTPLYKDLTDACWDECVRSFASHTAAPTTRLEFTDKLVCCVRGVLRRVEESSAVTPTSVASSMAFERVAEEEEAEAEEEPDKAPTEQILPGQYVNEVCLLHPSIETITVVAGEEQGADLLVADGAVLRAIRLDHVQREFNTM